LPVCHQSTFSGVSFDDAARPPGPARTLDQVDAGQQQVRFCRSADGTRIAWSRHGSGPPLVVDTCWLSHLQYDWESPVWRHYLHGLGGFSTTVRYDERGFGMSDRAVTDFSFEQRIADLEAVVDAAGLERFSLLGMAQGGQVAIAYAARHPERVSRLILHSCYATMMTTPEDEAMEAAFVQLIKVGWARPESEFRRVFTSLMIPGATAEQMTWLDDLQRVCTSSGNAVAFRAARYGIDVSAVAAELQVPTLVLHARQERLNRFEEGLNLASLIPGARLVPLDSVNHILLGDEPAFQVFLRETRTFIGDAGSSPPGPSLEQLTPRERDVLRCAATGADNESIARQLCLSVRTVERHLQNAYTKLGVTGRSARAAAVAAVLGA
jgi:pimeloyl-ACP methyl ester carboxylesterase/DNA-binding CsgD family transcriptional regulator